MSDIISLDKIDEVNFKLTCNISQAMELKEHVSCYAPNYYYHPKFRAHCWNGKISFFEVRKKLFPIGLLPMFMSFVERFNYKYKFNFDTKSLSTEIEEKELVSFYDNLFKGTKYYPRDYQHDAIFRALKNKRGLLVLPTGSGKSICIYVIVRIMLGMDKQVLLVVPNVSLVEQMYSDFQDYGWKDLGKYCNKLYSKKELNLKNPVLISTWQSIYNKKEQFFSRFGCLINDETHLSKSLSLRKIGQKCLNADFRIGTTGTLNQEKADKWNIYSILGPKLIEKISSELIDAGVLSKIVIANLIAKYPKHVIDKNKNRPYPEEVDTILEYKNRDKILNFIFDNTPDGQNTMVLCHRIKHLKRVEEYLLKHLPDKYEIFVIYGQIEAQEREAIRKMMEEKENLVLVCTYQTVGTGINIKRLHQVIFYASYKSKIKVLQSLGRGLRKHATKTKLILWDIIDDLRWKKRTGKLGENHIFKHWKARMKYYKEQGFKSVNREIRI